MRDWRSQAHVKWECKFHVVIVPKYRRKEFFGRRRGEIGKVLRELCQQKGIELLEGRAMPDHVHMLLSVSTEVQHCDGSRVPEREECDSDKSGTDENVGKLVWPSVLVTRVLCEYRWSG